MRLIRGIHQLYKRHLPLPHLVKQFSTNNPTQKLPNLKRFAVILSLGGTIYVSYSYINQPLHASVQVNSNNLPHYTIADVREHNDANKSVWVTYKNGVYDITKFVDEHPGNRSNILMAAGNALDPFWELYAFHKSGEILEILESMRCGWLDDAEESTEKEAGPYSGEPKRTSLFRVASETPFNAEPPAGLLVSSFITPTEVFYVRNHLPVPDIDINDYNLLVDVGTKQYSLSLDELKQLPVRTITATIMCAGNRRSEMSQIKPVKGLSWNAAAVGTATWTGVLLRDLLKSLGVFEDASFKHVQFEAADVDVSNVGYGASIPFWRAIDRNADVLLAFEMNGEPITRDHGFPLRVIVPGVVGARNVKWLERIILADDESPSHWQQNDYKGFCPSVDWDTVDFSKAAAIQEMPVISAICTPDNGEVVTVKNGKIQAKGYAWSGNGQRILRVDLSVDQGRTWFTAELDQLDCESPRHWAWTLWAADIPVENGAVELEIWVKAVDSCYNTQPERFENIWNLRGVLNNAYHRVKVLLERS